MSKVFLVGGQRGDKSEEKMFRAADFLSSLDYVVVNPRAILKSYYDDFKFPMSEIKKLENEMEVKCDCIGVEVGEEIPETTKPIIRYKLLKRRW